jgi:hypothetical protein
MVHWDEIVCCTMVGCARLVDSGLNALATSGSKNNDKLLGNNMMDVVNVSERTQWKRLL